MNPEKVSRERLSRLTDLPNIGKAMAEDLRRVGITEPSQLAGRSAFELYRDLCRLTNNHQDPCVLDVFMSVTSFMSGKEARPWWKFTEERKRLLGTFKPQTKGAG